MRGCFRACSSMKKSQQGSLFSYFKPVNKSSKGECSYRSLEAKTNGVKSSGTPVGRKRAATPASEEKRVPKRQRQFSDESSGDEYVPPSEAMESSSGSSGEEEEEMEVELTPVKKTKKLAATPVKKTEKPLAPAKTPKTTANGGRGFKTPTSAAGSGGRRARTPTANGGRGAKTPTANGGRESPAMTPRSLGSSSYCLPSPVTPAPSSSLGNTDGGSFHEQLTWLKEENRKDKNGRRRNHPDFNPRTLYVPAEFLKKLSPGLRQWWDIKADNFDTVIMFKVGKFYELYHMDAVIGVKELGLVFMKGEYSHSGFPEVAFSRYSQTLVQKGYKVARVEQTETPEMMQQRLKKTHRPTKFDRVVKRELCSIITKGTRTLSFMGEDYGDSESAYLISIKEAPFHATTASGSLFGVCFIDACIGTFHLSQFSDDRRSSRLRTLLAHHPPAQLLTERSNLSPQTSLSLHALLASTIRDTLAPGTEFWSSSKTLEMLRETGCFDSEDEDGTFSWPDNFQSFISQDDPLGMSASSDYELAVSALGACVWYLQRCFIDKDLLSMKSFQIYHPLDCLGKGPSAVSVSFAGQSMILDDITLSNLDVIDIDGKLAGTLLERVDHTSTPFGKRLLKAWLCSPPCDPQLISSRLDALDDLLDESSLIAAVKERLKRLPDLERLLRKIHTLGLSARSEDHPDARAIIYSETIYSKRKICDFISVLDGLQSAIDLMEHFRSIKGDFKSKMLKGLVTLTTSGGKFPDMAQQLKFFQTSFNHDQAKKAGVIVPSPGVDASYDTAISQIKATEHEFQEYLTRQRKKLGCKSIVYWGSGRNRYQLEVPESVLSRHTPDDYELMSQKKGYRRYWTKDIERMLEKMVDAESRRDAALKDTMRSLFSSFDKHFPLWECAVQCLGILDVLCSLATYCICGEGEMCRPRVLPPTAEGGSFLRIVSGRHPCISQTYSGEEFIPNDVVIEGQRLCTLVTGPNMGGKSTLMRQTGLIVILAQLGCYVPAVSCELTPVDRLFTRLGASDRIMSGESTFFVELSETATILQHATAHSLVLLDELGRGTATYDGTAIACAVVHQLAESICCRSLFSTHYHSLVEEFASNPHIQLGHMACEVEKSESVDDVMFEGAESTGDEGEETITFLYKFSEGACPKSYGFNAAQLAGLPRHVIQLARRKAHNFETTTQNARKFRKLMSSGAGF